MPQVKNKYTDLDKYANASNAVSLTLLRSMNWRSDYKDNTGVTFWREVSLQILEGAQVFEKINPD